MGAKILILLILAVAVMISAGCVQEPTCNPPYIVKGYECCLDQNGNSICDTDEQQPPAVQGQCPLSCDDGNECTRDYCSATTNYECRNDIIIPCCGNGDCESRENYTSCSEDCNEPIEVGEPNATENIIHQVSTYWTILRRVVYNPPPANASDSVVTIPISINEKIGEIRVETECSENMSVVPNHGSFECGKPSDCSLAKSDTGLDYTDVVRDLKKGDSVNAKFTLQANFDDKPYDFNCKVTFVGSNPDQTEFLNLQITYNNYGA